MSVTASELCTIAKSDALHDFSAEAVAIASKSIPLSGVSTCKERNEDKLLYDVLGISRDKEYDNIFKLLKDSPLHGQYTCLLNNENDMFDTVFTTHIGNQNVYFIVDVTTEGMKDQLSNLRDAKDRKGPIYYWIQNRQTLYDPAGKTDPFTKAGKDIFRNNSHVKFAWEDSTHDKFSKGELYPPWNTKKKEVKLDELSIKNEMFYSTNTIYQILHTINDNNFKTQKTKCVMKLPTNKIVVMNKEAAKISGGSFGLGEYRSLFTELKKFIIKIFKGEKLEEEKKFTQQHHCPAKRLGDQGQALSCLQREFYLKTFKIVHRLEKDTLKPSNITKNVSNGIHCFVTIDRPALVASLKYGVPMALFWYFGGGFALFINNNLISDDSRLENKKKEYMALYTEYSAIKTVYLDVRFKMEVVVNKLKQELKDYLNIPVPDTNSLEQEKYYRSFILYYFHYIRSIHLFTIIHDTYRQLSLHIKPDNIKEFTTKNISKIDDTVKILEKNIQTLIKLNNTINLFVNEYTNSSSKTDKLTLGNVNASGLFIQASKAQRLFIGKREQFTLGLYIKEIYEALHDFNIEIAHLFREKIKNICSVVRGYKDEYHNVMAEYLENIVVETIQPKNSIPKKLIIRAKIKGGANLKENLIIDETIRTIFSLYILSQDIGVPFYSESESYDIKSTMKNVYKLLMDDIDINTDMNNIYNINKKDNDSAPYYIDFVEHQIYNSQYSELAILYNELINAYELNINGYYSNDIYIPDKLLLLVNKWIIKNTAMIYTPTSSLTTSSLTTSNLTLNISTNGKNTLKRKRPISFNKIKALPLIKRKPYTIRKNNTRKKYITGRNIIKRNMIINELREAP